MLGVVEQHGGWIDIDSEVGQGSAFKIFLPADRSKGYVVSTAACREEAFTVLLVSAVEGALAETLVA